MRAWRGRTVALPGFRRGGCAGVVLDCAFPGHLPDPPDTLAEAPLFTAIITNAVTGGA